MEVQALEDLYAAQTTESEVEHVPGPHLHRNKEKTGVLVKQASAPNFHIPINVHTSQQKTEL